MVTCYLLDQLPLGWRRTEPANAKVRHGQVAVAMRTNTSVLRHSSHDVSVNFVVHNAGVTRSTLCFAEHPTLRDGCRRSGFQNTHPTMPSTRRFLWLAHPDATKIEAGHYSAL